MTTTTREIFENFEIRKTKRQKAAFRQWLIPILERNGYSVTVEKGGFGAWNVVIGDVEQAEVVFTAHYDTCAVLPFPNFITPKCPALYILYQVLISVLALVILFGVSFALAAIAPELFLIGFWIAYLVIFGGMLFGPANKHTANDNTSGITTVIDLALSMPEELRGKAAFVLFDLEEAGLLGSSSFASKHKKQMKEKPLVNLDCVSDGETMLFVFRKKAKKLQPRFREVFVSTASVQPDFAVKGYIYPSDQANFPWGIGVAALKKTKGGLLYMNRIHTKRDTVYREENIAYLVDGCIRLTKSM